VLDAGIRGGGPGGPGPGARGRQDRGAAINPAAREPEPGASPQNPQRDHAPRPASAPDRLSFTMMGSPEVLVAQNNYSFDDLVATCRRQNPKWDIVDCQYWALSKKLYHGAYSAEAFREVMQGSMRTGESLAKIPVPMIILKADASPEQREAHQEAASVMQKGKLVHIDGGGHNLHHDQLERTAEVLTEFLSTL
jgi:pimeloyl-ACP methyl ester carboxylesterase